MGLFDDETIAKLRAMKDILLGQNNTDNTTKESKNDKEIERPAKKTKKLPTVEYRRIEEPSIRKMKQFKKDKNNIKIIKDIKKEVAFTTNTSSTEPQNSVFDEDIDLCIGLDIGTSTTKAVIKEVYSDNDTFYIVDFGEYGIKDQEYLIPTYLCEKNEMFYIPKYGQGYTYSNLKLNFIDAKKDADTYLRAYVGLIIQYIKNWFKKEHGNDDIIKNKNIIWQVNLGIPSAQFNDEGENAKFLKILKEGYYWANLPKISRKSSVAEAKQVEKQVDLNIVPEIVASIQSYIKRNDISHEGLYCVADIGAGTLDICTFRVKEDDIGNVIYSFFKSKVEPLGTKIYQKSLLKYKNTLADMVLNKEKEILLKSVDHIITDCSDYLIIDEMQKQQQRDIDVYKNKVMTCFREVLFRTYQVRDPKAKEWIETLPLAVSGGGISIPLYKDLVNNDLSIWLKTKCGDHQGRVRCKGFRNINIAENQRNLISKKSNIDCTRIAVAVGLSYSIDNFDEIKKYYKECEIEDIDSSSKKDFEENYIDKSCV